MSIEFRNYCLETIKEINESIERLKKRQKYCKKMKVIGYKEVIEITNYLIKIKTLKIKELKNRIEEDLEKNQLKNKGNQLLEKINQ